MSRDNRMTAAASSRHPTDNVRLENMTFISALFHGAERAHLLFSYQLQGSQPGEKATVSDTRARNVSAPGAKFILLTYSSAARARTSPMTAPEVPNREGNCKKSSAAPPLC